MPRNRPKRKSVDHSQYYLNKGKTFRPPSAADELEMVWSDGLEWTCVIMQFHEEDKKVSLKFSDGSTSRINLDLFQWRFADRQKAPRQCGEDEDDWFHPGYLSENDPRFQLEEKDDPDFLGKESAQLESSANKEDRSDEVALDNPANQYPQGSTERKTQSKSSITQRNLELAVVPLKNDRQLQNARLLMPMKQKNQFFMEPPWYECPTVISTVLKTHFNVREIKGIHLGPSVMHANQQGGRSLADPLQEEKWIATVARLSKTPRRPRNSFNETVDVATASNDVHVNVVQDRSSESLYDDLPLLGKHGFFKATHGQRGSPERSRGVQEDTEQIKLIHDHAPRVKKHQRKYSCDAAGTNQQHFQSLDNTSNVLSMDKQSSVHYGNQESTQKEKDCQVRKENPAQNVLFTPELQTSSARGTNRAAGNEHFNAERVRIELLLNPLPAGHRWGHNDERSKESRDKA